MHIVQLAVAPDCISSVMLDLTDDGVDVVCHGARDQKLQAMWQSYHEWCEAGSLSSDLIFIFHCDDNM